MKKLLIPLAVASLFAFNPAQANDGPSIDARQARQIERIRDGVRSGDLTRREARSLMDEQRWIREKEAAYRADGVLTPRERFDLQRDLDRASDNIRAQKHDAERVGAYHDYRGYDNNVQHSDAYRDHYRGHYDNSQYIEGYRGYYQTR